MDIVHVIEVKVCIPEDGQPKPIESLVASVKSLHIEARIFERTLTAMDVGFMFLLGICLGSLMMLFVILRLISGMHDQIEQNLGKR